MPIFSSVFLLRSNGHSGAEWGAGGHSGGSLLFLQVVSIHMAGGRSLSRAGGLLYVCVEWQVLTPHGAHWYWSGTWARCVLSGQQCFRAWEICSRSSPSVSRALVVSSWLSETNGGHKAQALHYRKLLRQVPGTKVFPDSVL